MIEITQEAAKYITSKSDTGFRLKVKNSGCNGFMYEWSIASTNGDDDIVTEQNGAKLLVDKMTYLYIQDSKIDLETDKFSSSLKVINPQVKNTCGCGESFSV